MHVQPLFRIINSRRVVEEWNPSMRGALVSTIVNRQWPQARLAQAKLVESRNCRLCVHFGHCTPQDEDPKHKGTLVHRLWICPVLHPYRCKWVDPALMREARSKIAVDGSMAPSDLLLYTRAIMPSLEPKVPKQDPNPSFEWVVRPFDSTDCS
eukprot:8807706-Karenia_brevis.AAC.1